MTKVVMEKVMSFEERRSKGWVIRFLTAVSILTVVMLWAFIRSYQTLTEQRTFDVMEILWEDSEVISEFWLEASTTVLTELPQWFLFVGIGCIALGVGFWLGTRRTHMIIKRRIAELAKHKIYNNNREREGKHE